MIHEIEKDKNYILNNSYAPEVKSEFFKHPFGFTLLQPGVKGESENKIVLDETEIKELKQLINRLYPDL